VSGPVIIEKQRRVNSFLLHPNGLRPFTGRVFRCYKKVAAFSDIGGNHIKHVIIRVIPDGRGVNTPGARHAVKIELAFPGKTMADLLPVYQICGMKNRYPRKELKGTCNKIKILSLFTNAGIRVKAGDNRIVIAHNNAP
jgi:hypothetical protein